MERTAARFASWMLAGAALAAAGCSGPAQAPPTTTPTTTTTTTAADADEPAGEATPSSSPETDSPRPLPARVSAVVDATTDAGPRFVNMKLDLGSGLPWTITGCTSGLRGGCDETLAVELTEEQRVALIQRLVAVQQEGCHDVLEPGGVLSVEVGLVYDGPCGAEADLAWWLADQFDPGVLGRG